MKLQKTDLARELLRSPRRDLPAGERMLLITVDGRRDLPQLRALARNLGLDPAVVESLYGRGLIAPVPAEAGTASTASTASTATTAPPVMAPALAPKASSPGASPPPSATPFHPQLSSPAGTDTSQARQALIAAQRAAEAQTQRLLRAKVYALDLVGRMLAGQDGELRALARHIDNQDGLMLWIEVAAQQLLERAGEARSERFRQLVLEELGLTASPA